MSIIVRNADYPLGTENRDEKRLARAQASCLRFLQLLIGDLRELRSGKRFRPNLTSCEKATHFEPRTSITGIRDGLRQST
jgi:hypothetical protein